MTRPGLLHEADIDRERLPAMRIDRRTSRGLAQSLFGFYRLTNSTTPMATRIKGHH